MEDTRKIQQNELLALSPDGRKCEVCGLHPHKHRWMTLDFDGFAVACSEESSETNNKQPQFYRIGRPIGRPQ